MPISYFAVSYKYCKIYFQYNITSLSAEDMFRKKNALSEIRIYGEFEIKI